MLRRAAAVLSVYLGACAVDDRPRYFAAEDGFSIAELPGWEVRRDRDTVVFRSPARLGDGRVTVAVRSVPLEAGWAELRGARRVVAETQTVLAALPQADLRGPAAVSKPGYEGARFDLVYAPASSGGARYHRRHVVLVSSARHIFHVFLTAPVDEGRAFEQALPVLDDVVASLRQEV